MAITATEVGSMILGYGVWHSQRRKSLKECIFLMCKTIPNLQIWRPFLILMVRMVHLRIPKTIHLMVGIVSAMPEG